MGMQGFYSVQADGISPRERTGAPMSRGQRKAVVLDWTFEGVQTPEGNGINLLPHYPAPVPCSHFDVPSHSV